MHHCNKSIFQPSAAIRRQARPRAAPGGMRGVRGAGTGASRHRRSWGGPRGAHRGWSQNGNLGPCPGGKGAAGAPLCAGLSCGGTGGPRGHRGTGVSPHRGNGTPAGWEPLPPRGGTGGTGKAPRRSCRPSTGKCRQCPAWRGEPLPSSPLPSPGQCGCAGDTESVLRRLQPPSSAGGSAGLGEQRQSYGDSHCPLLKTIPQRQGVPRGVGLGDRRWQ